MEKSTVVDVRISQVSIQFEEDGKTTGRNVINGAGKVGQQRLFSRLETGIQKAVINFIQASAGWPLPQDEPGLKEEIIEIDEEGVVVAGQKTAAKLKKK
ncbi:MAG: hypothetical protein V3R83_09955 [Gammaproteobacteria bacterium]